MTLILEGVLDRQDASPGMSEEVKVGLVKTERLPHLLLLPDEARNRPQRRIVGLVAVRGAKLVIVVVLDPGGRQVGIAGLEVLVGCCRTTVQEEQPGGRIVADS